MDLYEYQAKLRFARHGIPIKEGDVAQTAEAARAIAQRLGGTVVVKAQVHTGGRGKAGGVKLAGDATEAEAVAGAILGMDIKGHTVRTVLVDPAVDIDSEFYLACVLDRSARRILIMASGEGGVDIEQVAEQTPDKIHRVRVDPGQGIQAYQTRQLAFGVLHSLPVERQPAFKAAMRDFQRIVTQLYETCVAEDATLAEINPLVITTDGQMLALDGKVTIDNSALFRQPELAAMRDPGAETDAEREAREAGLSYVDLDGNIGCLVNGAGLAMATMDVIQFFGGSPANFLDIGGGAQAEKVATALRIILSDERVEAVLINIFGGITRGDEVARGVLAALQQLDTDVPFVVRIEGTNAEAGRAILADADMNTATTLAEGAQMAIALAGERSATRATQQGMGA
jgi:succinyl-CoA synthetase beta subunit